MAEVEPQKQTSDEVLVRMACSGQLDAMDILIDRYYSVCFGTCMAILQDQDHASDACQNCFVKIFRSISRFRGDGTFRSWALTIARNESLALLRQKKTRREIAYDKADLQLQDKENVSEKIFSKMEVSRVRKAFETLPKKQRLAVKLRIDGGLSFREIGQIIESSEGAARVSYHHGVRKLRELLEQ